MRKLIAILLAALAWSSAALAQNPTCATAPFGDNSNRCASTAFVQAALIGILPVLPNNQVYVGGPSNVAVAVTLSGDCTIINTGAITCTKTGGVAFAPSATTDTTNAANISSGTLVVARGGTGAVTNTAHGVMIGQGTSAVTAVAPSASFLPLVSGGTGSDPAYASITVPAGGTGATTLTAHAILLGQGTSAVTGVGPSATSSTVLASSGSSTDPVMAHIAGILNSICATPGSILLRATAIWNCQPPVTSHAVVVGQGASALSSTGPCSAGQTLIWVTSSQDPTCGNTVGTGTVTSITTTSALSATPSTITSSGVIGLNDMAAATIKGRASGAGTGTPTDLSATQAATILQTVGGTVKSKVISFSRDLTAVNGSVAYTGMGFQPTFCVITGGIAAGTNLTVGFAGQSGQGVATYLGAVSTFNNSVAIFAGPDTTNFQLGSLASFDADGFTVTWTKTNTPSGTFGGNALCGR